MGKKIDQAYERLFNETNHYTKLAQTRDNAWDAGFASGFAEALRIIQSIRG